MRSPGFRVATGVVAVLVSYAATLGVARVQAADAPKAAEAGRVEFDHPGAGDASVQVDLPAGLLGDVVGLGDAAVAGIAESLLQAKTQDEKLQTNVKLATEQLAGIRSILGNVQQAVGEVRVRVYQGGEDELKIDPKAVAKHYSEKLAGTEWAKIVQVRDGDESATVFLMRRDGAIRGVFVVASDGHEMAVVNVLCDISPERVKQITQQATSIGLKVGGEEQLREVLEDILEH